MTDRRRPIFEVEVEGSKVPGIASLGAVVSSVSFSEREDDPDTIQIDVDNVNEIFIQNPKAAEGVVVSVAMGYRDDLSDFGLFRLKRPSYIFPSTGHVSFSFKGERTSDTKLSQSEERRQFKSVTHSEVAETLAGELGLKTFEVDPVTRKRVSTVTKTKKRYDTVTFANETKMEFLRRLAKKHGFQVWVEDEVLHFEPVKDKPVKDSTGNIPVLQWKRDIKGTISEARVKDDGSGKAKKSTASGINPTTGEEVEQEGDPLPKKEGTKGQPTSTKTQKEFAYEVYTGDLKKVNVGKKGEISTKEEGKKAQTRKESPVSEVTDNPKTYETGEADVTDSESAKRVSEGKSQASAWSIEVDCETVIGYPWLRKNKTVFIEGLSRFSGKFLITATEHTISDSGYSVSFTAKTYKSQKTTTTEAGPSVSTEPADKPGKPPKDKKKKSDNLADKGKLVSVYDVRTGRLKKVEQ